MSTAKPFQSYDQQNNDLQQAIVHTSFSQRKEELILNEKPLFSKNQLEEIRKKIPYYYALGIVTGLLLAWAFFKIL